MTDKIPLTDRRKSGVHTTHISDGNGGVFSLITATFSTAKVVVTTITAIGVMLGGVYAMVRTGVGHEVHKQIDSEARDPNGAIRVEMLKCVETHADEFEEKFGKKFEESDQMLQEQNVLWNRMDERIEAMGNKVDDNQRELLRAIERAGGG